MVGCGVVWCGVVWCGVLWWIVAWCGVLRIKYHPCSSSMVGGGIQNVYISTTLGSIILPPSTGSYHYALTTASAIKSNQGMMDSHTASPTTCHHVSVPRGSPAQCCAPPTQTSATLLQLDSLAAAHERIAGHTAALTSSCDTMMAEKTRL